VTAMDPIPAAPASPPAGALYDSRRGVYYVKPVLRGWLHLLWFEASLVLGTLLVARAHGAVRITALAIYAASVSAMFGISALYHRGNWSAAWNRRLQRLDHAMIFLLIAGTAAAVRLAWMSAPELVAGSAFVGLGWVAILALPDVWTRAGAAAGVLMLLGGLLYTAGALSYHWRRPDPYPAVFGFHEVFHACVCAAAACQYAAIALFLTSQG